MKKQKQSNESLHLLVDISVVVSKDSHLPIPAFTRSISFKKSGPKYFTESMDCIFGGAECLGSIIRHFVVTVLE